MADDGLPSLPHATAGQDKHQSYDLANGNGDGGASQLQNVEPLDWPAIYDLMGVADEFEYADLSPDDQSNTDIDDAYLYAALSKEVTGHNFETGIGSGNDTQVLDPALRAPSDLVFDNAWLPNARDYDGVIGAEQSDTDGTALGNVQDVNRDQASGNAAGLMPGVQENEHHQGPTDARPGQHQHPYSFSAGPAFAGPSEHDFYSTAPLLQHGNPRSGNSRITPASTADSIISPSILQGLTSNIDTSTSYPRRPVGIRPTASMIARRGGRHGRSNRAPTSGPLVGRSVPPHILEIVSSIQAISPYGVNSFPPRKMLRHEVFQAHFTTMGLLRQGSGLMDYYGDLRLFSVEVWHYLAHRRTRGG